MKNIKTYLLAIFILPMTLIFLQCEKEISLMDQAGDTELESRARGGIKGKPGVEISNNLSFPALIADGYPLPSPILEPSFTVPYEGPYDGLTQEEIDALEANGPWFAQKVEGNVWQADFESLSNPSVAFIDWGDAIEAVDPKVGRPFRLELCLYQASNMQGYEMALLAFPSSKNEVQGTNSLRYDYDYAAIVSDMGKLVVQKFDEGAELTWNAELSQWDGANSPETGFTFSTELNVGGKFIFGASKKGWRPKDVGNYRITFYMEDGSQVDLKPGMIGNYGGDIPSQAENNQPMVHQEHNLTYVDVQATGGGGGRRR